jgi:hypothetical protein
VVGRYAEYFTLGDVVALMMPPYTFRDALPGVRHFVPKPFQEPALNGQSDGDSITVGTLTSGNPIQLSIRSLVRHLFVTGASGAGKSNTMMQIVQQLHAKGVPVLIIDPVKRDFEPLMHELRDTVTGRPLDDRIIDFRSRWLRFNPFIPAPNKSLYDHASIVAKVLAMLFPTNAVAYEILLGMVKDTYLHKLSTEYGRTITPDEFITRFTGKALRRYPRLAPTFDEFLEIGLGSLQATSDRAASRFQAEALEHFQRRWANIRKSAFKRMVSPPRRDQTIDKLFCSTHLLQFSAWSDEDEANAAFALVLSMMHEQRMSDFEESMAKTGQPPTQTYMALLDEAHRIVPCRLGSGDSDLVSAAQVASSLLTRMIAECRALGQGIMIGEQSASKIDPDVLINTSTKIVHTVLFGRDKQFLSEGLSLSPAEEDYLAYLQVGEALVFTPDAYQPLYARIPEFKTTGAASVIPVPA